MDPTCIIASTPARFLTADIAIAASRAGAVPCLNLESVPDRCQAQTLVERYLAYGRSPLVVRLGSGQYELLAELIAMLHENLVGIVLADAWDPQWEVLRKSTLPEGIAVWVELTDASQFPVVVGLRADGVWLKGNETGGYVGETTAFVLVQQWKFWAAQQSLAQLPFWVHGGMGEHSAVACLVAGAAGVVLDSQLLLAAESPVEPHEREHLERMDGMRSHTFGTQLNDTVRLYVPPQARCFDELPELEDRYAIELQSSDKRTDWRQAVNRAMATHPVPRLACVGQDIAIAQGLAAKYHTVGGIVTKLAEAAGAALAAMATQRPFGSDCGVSQLHGTRYPLLQGPMTRVSDTPEFIDAVAQGGALPFLALALMREREAGEVLRGTQKLLGERPWGVGLLGFLPPEIRQEQMRLVKQIRPRFALIAGGRPDQAKELEELGITTYLHVPSPGLIKMFVRDGARRFVFEGRECGGHVGPRSSFLLWDLMVTELLERVNAQPEIASELTIAFAGGIHDSLSAAMAMAIASPLLQRGVGVGLLMGTAYLATEEAVTTGAIVPKFQQEVFRARQTVLFATGPGHAVRCIETPYYRDFEAEKKRLRKAGTTHEEMVRSLEMMNIGRLRIASKGLDRVPSSDGLRQLQPVDESSQFERGMYMVGQIAALHDQSTTIEQLHAEVCVGAQKTLLDVTTRWQARVTSPAGSGCDIAIIGMACYYPDAIGLRSYWENILKSHYAVTEIPSTHWDWRLYYDSNPMARDRIISKWGGFLGDVVFDPLRYGITPKSVASIEPLQLLLLEVVREAIADAGYAEREFARDKTAAILGIGGGGSPLAVAYGFRACLPLLDNIHEIPVKAAEIVEICADRLPEWTEDSFPGFLLNVAVGRIANRFNFGGANYAIDAACASSLAAVHACVRELESGTADVAVAMGADTVQTPYAYMAFSKTHALSPQGRCRPFDASADGIVLSEGMGAIILKRLADAERDGDRVYAVIRGVGSSSDGKDKGLTAPNAMGQQRALARAYEHANISPATVGLIEAHGTGTVVGDRTEFEALSTTLRTAGAGVQSCALGSVKSMIGHSKCAAGIAGLIKTAMALHHRVLPPTLVEQPNPKIALRDGPLYLNTKARPWLHTESWPRRAGVSAFGFGGTNVHVAMEEYTGEYLRRNENPATRDWPTELFVLRQSTVEALCQHAIRLRDMLESGACPRTDLLAASLWSMATPQASDPTLAIIADSREQLTEFLSIAIAAMEPSLPAAGPRHPHGHADFRDPRGIYFSKSPAKYGGKLAVVFPGQGAQYPNMGSDLALAFPCVHQALDALTRCAAVDSNCNIVSSIYPPSWFCDEDRLIAEQRLSQTDISQPAVGAISLAMWKLWEACGVRADLMAGHSFGEFTALCAGGYLTERDLIKVACRRGEILKTLGGSSSGAMAALMASLETAQQLVREIPQLTIANINAPEQIVLSGPTEAIDQFLQAAVARKVKAQRLAVSCAFHSPAMRPAMSPFEQVLQSLDWKRGTTPVYSNVTANVHGNDTREVRKLLTEHLTAPVRFMDEILAMHDAGTHVFLEVGPQRQMSGLVARILGDRPHVAISTDIVGKHGVTAWQHAAAQLMTNGIAVNLDPVFSIRQCVASTWDELLSQRGHVTYSPTTFLVNGTRSKLWNAPEPKLLGQPPLEGTSTIQPSQAATHEHTQHKDTQHQTVSSTKRIERIEPMNSPNPPARSETTATSSPAISAVASNNGQSSSSPNHPPHRQLAPSNTQSSHEGVDAVMLSFQQVMAKFLETQRDVMSQFLSGLPPTLTASPSAATLPPAVSPTRVPTNAQPAENGAAEPVRRERQATNGSVPAPVSSSAASVATAATSVPGRASVNRISTSNDSTQTPTSTRPNENSRTREIEADGQAAARQHSMEEVAAKLIQLVSQRTGYPPEMLGMEMDLEADLGIDSIKRVEILGDLAEVLGISTDDDTALDFEKLTTLRSLQGILAYLKDFLGMQAGSAPERATVPPSNHEPTKSIVAIQRGLVELSEVPLPPNAQFHIPAGGVIITDDGRGIAASLAERLSALDIPTAVVGFAHHKDNGHTAERVAVDWNSAVEVESLCGRLRDAWGGIAGLFHLASLRQRDDQPWQQRALQDLKGLYLFAKHLEDDLQAAGKLGSAWVLAATGLGGSLGFEPAATNESLGAGQGGILGFMKCLAMELESVHVRAVDVNPEDPVAKTAERLFQELGDVSGPSEIGHFAGRRVTWSPIAAPLDKSIGTRLDITERDTILITGGARGITAAVARRLAEMCQPRLILVGRSPLPTAAELADTANLIEPAAIKAALIERARQSGHTVQPAAIESEYQRLMREREVRNTLMSLRCTGATVEYHQIDVTDADAMAGLLEMIDSHYGGLQGIIHGAGIIDDKLVRDKTPESLERVFRTKVESAAILARLVRPESLKFCVFFSSIASRYGNRGQADYAAANEVLSKLAWELDRVWPARVCAIAWGPWAEIGMVADLERHLTARGVSLIAPEVGVRFLLEELFYGAKGESEVLIAGGAEHLVKATESAVL